MYYHKRIIIFLFFICALVVNLQCFHQISSYSELNENLFKECNKNTIVTFDVDDTLITTLDFIGRDLEQPISLYLYLAFKFPSLIFKGKKLEKVISIILRDRSCIVFDKYIHKIIKKFRQKNCILLALTNIKNSSYGVIKYLPTWRFNQLKSLGFNFSSEFPNTTFTNLKPYKKQYPCLFSGILCTNKQDKGKLLGAFIDRFKLRPNKIISFDDLKAQLTSIQNECIKRKINFVGIQPFGAKNIQVDRSYKKAASQINNILKNGIL